MTLLALPATTDPVAVLDAFVETLTGLVPTTDQTAALRAVGRAESALAAFKLGVLAAADRSQTARGSGMADTGQWAARVANSDPAVAHRQVALAQRLEQRSATQKALAAGLLSVEHAGVIVRAGDQLPAGVTPAQRVAVEEALVEKAKVMAPALLRRAARRALAEIEPDPTVVDAHENDLVASEEDRARAKTRLSLHDNGDGTVTGHFTVPTLHGHLLRKIIHTITAPRRGRLGASHAQVGDATAQTAGLRTDWDHARGNALCELIEHLPTDHLHPRTAATLVVSVELETLRGALKVAGIDTSADLSAGQVRQLGCNAHLIPVVLGGKSLPLDLGRSSRLFNEPQRTALGLIHRTCIADGCERPYSWCELHHQDPWSHGGTTNLADAVPLCHFHHQRIHDSRYESRHGPGGITFHMRR